MSDIIGIFRDIGQLIVATLVERHEDRVVVKDPALIGIGGQGQQINIQFIPLGVLSPQPVVQVSNLVKNPLDEVLYTFYKDKVLNLEVELADQVIENYKKTFNKTSIIVPDRSVVPASQTDIVKLF